MDSSPDPFSSEWADQQAHQRMKAWMNEHNWSISFSADPADIFEFLQEHGDDADFDTFSTEQETK